MINQQLICILFTKMQQFKIILIACLIVKLIMQLFEQHIILLFFRPQTSCINFSQYKIGTILKCYYKIDIQYLLSPNLFRNFCNPSCFQHFFAIFQLINFIRSLISQWFIYFIFQIIIMSDQESTKSSPSNGYLFFIFVFCWHVALYIIFGIYFGYNLTDLTAGYSYNSLVSVIIMTVFVVPGFALVSAYVTKSSVSSMVFTLLIFVLTLENFFIFRCFWNKVGINRVGNAGSFYGGRYSQIQFLPTGNDRQVSFQYGADSFYDAIGCVIAMNAAFHAIIGRVGFAQIFMLTWIGPFFYQFSSELFWKQFIVDNGFGMRGFLFGGVLGIVISKFLGKKQQTKQHPNYASHYHVEGLACLGTILLCISYPAIISTGLLTSNSSTTGDITVYTVAQVNAWLSMAGSVVGAFTASTLLYRKFFMHDVVFTCLSGAIAFSSSTDVNWNPGAAIAIGSSVGFLSSLMHTPFKRWLNSEGVVDSNSATSHFIIPGIFACIFSAILSAIDKSAIGSLYAKNRDTNITNLSQGAWQLMGFVFAVGIAILAGIIIGLIFKCLNNFDRQDMFNDNAMFNGLNPRPVEQKDHQKQN